MSKKYLLTDQIMGISWRDKKKWWDDTSFQKGSFSYGFVESVTDSTCRLQQILFLRQEGEKIRLR